MANLVSDARAIYALGQAITTANYTPHSDESTTITALVTAASKAIKRWCRREFDSQSFDELYSGNGTQRLQLKEYPIVSVTRVAYGPTPLIGIKNTSWPTNMRATIRTSSTALVLTKIASGSSSSSSIDWATYTTLGAVVDQVNTLGNGWVARLLDSQQSTRASADIKEFQGAMDASNGREATIKLHIEEEYDYEIEYKPGILYKNCGWLEGNQNYRVSYTGGYVTVPEDVQEACVEWAIEMFWQTKRDPAQQTKVDASSNFLGLYPTSTIPEKVRGLLLPYRRVLI